MLLQLPSRSEFQHREDTELQGRWERPYKYLQSNKASMSQIQLVYQQRLAVFQLHLGTVLRTCRRRVKTWGNVTWAENVF